MPNASEIPNRDAPLVSATDQTATLLMFAWMQSFGQGIDATIVTAPLTGGGTPGSMTFVGGLLVAETPAT